MTSSLLQPSFARSTDFGEVVIATIAELTRYPHEILLPSAHLEDDLGIDSVKRAEILTALGQRMGVPPGDEAYVRNAGMPRTIGDLIALAESVAAAAGQAEAPPEVLAGAGPAEAAPPSGPMALQTVVDVVAELTRYPREILVENAHLEDDLGIDSVKRAEILTVLAQRLSIAIPSDPSQWVMPRTIGELAALGEQLAAAPAAAPAAPLRPIAVPPPTPERADTSQMSFTNPSIPRNRPPSGEARSVRVVPAGTPASISPAFLGTGAQARPFEGRVALVTGSGHGLGKVMAHQLADLGATVVVNSFYSRPRAEETTAEIIAAGGKAVHIWGSVANPVHLQKLFEEIDRRFGHLDFYIQNASNGVIGPLDQVTEEHWDRAFRTNVIGFHRAAYLAAELMKRRGGGRIIALSSPGAQRYIEYFGCLGPVKAAVESLARYLAVELGPHNIQVNVVSAGPVYGERLDNYPDAGRLIPYWETLSPDGRLGEAAEITANVLYLLSPAASKINGAVLLVDGAASLRM